MELGQKLFEVDYKRPDSMKEFEKLEIEITDLLADDLKSFFIVICAKHDYRNNMLDREDPEKTLPRVPIPESYKRTIQEYMLTEITKAVTTGIKASYEKEFEAMENSRERDKSK
jgi:hypothetical protein